MSDKDQRDAFAGRVEDSKDAVFVVARWLHDRGRRVEINPVKVAPDLRDWRKYTDGGDLMISMPVEVKGLSRTFSCKDDWPFGEHFIVNDKEAHDRAFPVPFAYIAVSADFQAVGVLLESTSKRWTVQKRNDKYKGGMKDYYIAPIDCVRFYSINDRGEDV